MSTTTPQETAWADLDLDDHHRNMLIASAISPEVARERGYRTLREQWQAEREGFRGEQALVPALLLPVHTVAGGSVGAVLRPDTPRVNGNGKPSKYEFMAGARPRIDVPPRARAAIHDPAMPLYVTEGAKKADAAVSAGLSCIALGGVWSWRGTGAAGGKAALADWESIALNGREVVLAFDSDAADNAQVAEALHRLGAFLAQRGAVVRYLIPPAAAETGKVGLDDLIVSLRAEGLEDDALRDAVRGLITADSPQPWRDPACAMRIVEQAAAAVKSGDVGAALGQAVTESLAALDPPERERGFMTLKSAGVRITELREHVRRLARDRQRERDSKERARANLGLRTFNPDDELRVVVPQVWRAVLDKERDQPTLFNRGGVVVEIRKDDPDATIRAVCTDAMYGHVFRAGAWQTETPAGIDPAKPPKDIARDMLVRPDPALPVLNGVTHVPCFGPGWRLVTGQGYDPATGIYGALPESLRGLQVPLRPTDEQVAAAIACLEEPLRDFPFASAADRAHAISALLVSVARLAIEGPTPIHLIEASANGAGKSLLADVIHYVAIGRDAAASVLPDHNDETIKLLTSLLLEDARVIVLDNVVDLKSPVLCATVTSVVWRQRILGSSRTPKLPVQCIWLLTANNPRGSTETARRCIRVRLEPDVEDPSARTDFAHPNLKGWVASNRPQLVQAALTVWARWRDVGAPSGAKTLGSFEAWAAAVGGALEVVGIEGFLDDRAELVAANDTECEALRRVVQVWLDVHGLHPVTAAVILDTCEREEVSVVELIGDRQGDTVRGRATRLGITLSRHRGRVVHGHRIMKGELSARRTVYSLERVGPADRGEGRQ